MVLLAVPLIVLFVLVLAMYGRVAGLEREVRHLRRRLDSTASGHGGAAPTTSGEAPAAAATPTLVPPIESPAAAQPADIRPLERPVRPVPGTPTPRPQRATLDLEQLVGGVWLQNAGAVLLLVAFFFLILWGYATRRLGPGVLVLAGALAGLGLVWRGDRMRRSVPGIGHALIGVGAGVLWLAVYMGHFELHVLPEAAAFALVVAASVFTGALGLRYGVQAIAALGVVGAQLPNLLGALVRSYSFSLPPSGLLGYLAGLNALVFALAARAGWSALALASLLLTAATWIVAVPASAWGWPVQIGLTALFAALGLAPVPWVARREATARPADLAVIAVAPLALLAASWPMFQAARPIHVSLLLLSLAIGYLVVSLWVDARRPDRDLWRPLVAAAVLFLSIAIERAVGLERTPLAWTLEGVALVWVGSRPRGGWLRTCGHVVAYAGALGLFARLVAGLSEHPLPLVNAAAITNGLAIAALLVTAHRLGRDRERTRAIERASAHLWFGGAYVLLLVWLTREAHLVAWAFEGAGGAWRRLPDLRAASSEARYWSLFISTTAFAWAAMAAWLVRTGVRARRGLARALGHAVGFLGGLLLLSRLVAADTWGRDLPPVIHAEALLALASLALAAGAAALLARRRDSLAAPERRSAELWAVGIAFVLMAWIARESDHLARVMLDVAGANAPGAIESAMRERVRSLGGTLTSVGWLLQAVAAFVIGWARRSSFLRWMGLALLGVTVLKFLLVDLAHADPLWRFLTAIAAGVAMLALSYVYQRAGIGRRRQPEG